MTQNPTKTSDSAGDAALRSALGSVAFSGLLLTVGSLVVAGSAWFGVLLGSLLAVLHLLGIAYTVRVMLGTAKAPLPWLGVAVAKLGLLLILVYALMVSPWAAKLGVSVLGLLAGYAALPLGITFAQFDRRTLGTLHPSKEG